MTNMTNQEKYNQFRNRFETPDDYYNDPEDKEDDLDERIYQEG